MNARKFICAIAAAFFAVLPLAACGNVNSGGGAYVIPKYAEGKSMTIAGGGIPMRLTQDAFDMAADAGFNKLYAFNMDFDKSYLNGLNMLNMAEAAGIHDVVITDNALVNSAFEGELMHLPSDDKNVKWYKGHPAFGGIVVCDEANASTYADLKEKYQMVRGMFPDKTMYLGANIKKLPFSEHLAEFIEEIGVGGWLGYNYYALFKDGTTRDDHFLHLEEFRTAAKEHNFRAAHWILAIEHWIPGKQGSQYAEITEDVLRWQIALDQAFGYDEVIYYTFDRPLGVDPKYGWVYADGIHKEDGSYNPEIYDMASKVNNEVHKWGHVYRGFTWQGISTVFGTAAEYDISIRMIKNAVKPDAIGGVKSVTSDNDLLMGNFKDANGNLGLYAVNASRPALKKGAKFTIEFDGYDGVQVFEKGVPRVIDLVKGKAEISLAAAEGKFLIPVKKGK